jgi:hypothetical protein
MSNQTLAPQSAFNDPDWVIPNFMFDPAYAGYGGEVHGFVPSPPIIDTLKPATVTDDDAVGFDGGDYGIQRIWQPPF